MNGEYNAYIAPIGQDVSQLPIIGQDVSIHLTRRKRYNRNGYTYKIGNNQFGYSDNLSFDRMIVELRALISWYKDNEWLTSNSSARIRYNVRINKHYD